MSFAPGKNVWVHVEDVNGLVIAKILHENKSGSYRVTLGDGSKVTIPREDIFDSKDGGKSPPSNRKKSPGRSKSATRGRSPARSTTRAKSPGRKKSPARVTAKALQTPKTPRSPYKPEPESPTGAVRRSSRERRAIDKFEVTPQSLKSEVTLRLKRWQPDDVDSAVNSDGESSAVKGKKKGKAAEDKPTLEFGGVCGLTFMALLILSLSLGLHLILRSAALSVEGIQPNQTDLIQLTAQGNLNVRALDWRALWRTFPKWDWLAAKTFFGFVLGQVLLSYLPIGPVEKCMTGVPGPRTYRCNGLVMAFLTLSSVCLSRYYLGWSLTSRQLTDLTPWWICLAAGWSLLEGVVCAWRASRLPLAGQNLAVQGAGRIYGFYMGREVNPHWGKFDLKTFLFKFAFITTLTLQLLLWFSLDASQQRSPTLLLCMGMICTYVGDVLLFERYLMSTYVVTSEGLGFIAFLGMSLYPFMALSLTKYVAVSRYEANNWICGVVACLFLLGYVVYRCSNAQKGQFRKNPLAPNLSHIETMPTSRGKRLLVSGWWGFVRHPNYLGDIMMHLSMCLITCFTNPIPLVMPVLTVLGLLHRAARDNRHCKAKYGDSWAHYCERVPYRICPRVY